MQISPFDPVLLIVFGFFTGFLYRSWLFSRNRDWFVFLFWWFIAVFWLHAVLVYMGLDPWFFGLGYSSGSVLVGALFVLSYPFWFRLGAGAFFFLFGSNPMEGGVTWVFRLKDNTESFEESWED